MQKVLLKLPPQQNGFPSKRSYLFSRSQQLDYLMDAFKYKRFQYLNNRILLRPR